MKLTRGEDVLALIGSYADPAEPGLYVCKFDPATGGLELLDHAAGLRNPTFLDVDERSLHVYALLEETGSDGRRCGAAAAFAVDPATGRLSLLNKEATVAAPTCHITLDRTRRCLMVASYHGGMIGLSPVGEDGRVGAIADVHQHKGSSLLPVQDRPRPHSVFVDRRNRFAVVSDLGLDRLIVYRLDVEGRKLIPHSETRVTPGAGPRHFAFHPSLPYGYVINELNATITCFSFEEEQGTLTEIQTVPTLPDSYEGENSCADIHISPDGRFLYGSNRGHDSIAVYAIDPLTGRLSLVEHASTLGRHPRNFALSPDGRFLLAANRDTDAIVTFARDADTGRLKPAGHVLELSKPVCIKFVSL